MGKTSLGTLIVLGLLLGLGTTSLRQSKEMRDSLEAAKRSLQILHDVLVERRQDVAWGALRGPLELDSHEGVASWYGDREHGRLTASGVPFDSDAETGAHRKLRFGSVVVIENLESGKMAFLVINDRGPYIDGRHIDVSMRVAGKLEMLERGVVPVSYWVLPR